MAAFFFLSFLMLPSLGNLKPSYVSSLQLLAAGIFICQIELTGGRVLQCLTCGQTFCTDSFGGTQINIRKQAAFGQTHLIWQPGSCLKVFSLPGSLDPPPHLPLMSLSAMLRCKYLTPTLTHSLLPPCCWNFLSDEKLERTKTPSATRGR